MRPAGGADDDPIFKELAERKGSLNFYCLPIMILMVPIFMIAMGLVYVFNKDRAWRYAEWMLRNVQPQ